MTRLTTLAIVFALSSMPFEAYADYYVAADTILPGTVLNEDDLQKVNGNLPDAITSLDQTQGKETIQITYKGQPILSTNLSEQNLIRRGDIVKVEYNLRSLSISSTGVALESGSLADEVQILLKNTTGPTIAVIAGPGRLKIKN